MSRAMVVTEPGVLRWADVPDPAPGPHDVVVRVRFTGLCGTDLHIVEGTHPRVRFPIALGHELVGVPEAGELSGQRVLVDPLLPCGACRACQAGASNACKELRLIGIDRHGGLAGRVAVSADRLHPVPDGIPEELVPLAEPLAVAVHAVRKLPSLIGRTVVVVGGGTVGLLVAHLADLSGGSVLVMELAPARRRIAARLGYELLDAADPVGHLLARTSAQLADFAVDAAATPSVAALLCSLVGPMSSIAVIGAYGNLAAVDLQAVMFKELTVLGSRTYLPTDLDAALTLLNEGQSKLGLLLSGVVNAEAVAATIQSLKAGEGMKYVVECPV